MDVGLGSQIAGPVNGVPSQVVIDAVTVRPPGDRQQAPRSDGSLLSELGTLRRRGRGRSVRRENTDTEFGLDA